MLPNEHQLAATKQRLNVALVSPDLTNPSFEVLDSPNVFEDLNGIPSTAVQQPNAAANRLLSPTSLAGTPCGNSYNRATGSEPFPHQYAADSLQVVSVPTVVEATGRVTPLDSNGVQFTSDTSQVVAVPTAVGTTDWFNPLVSNGFQLASDPLQVVAVPAFVEANSRVTPLVSDSQPSNVAAQNAVSSMPRSFHPPGVSSVPVVAIPQLAELVPASSLPTTSNVVVPSALAASGSNPTESALVQQLQAEVTRLTNALQLQQQQLQQTQQRLRANPQPMEGASIASLPTAVNAVAPCAHAVSGLNPTMATTTKVMASSYAPLASIAKGAALDAPPGINLGQASLAGTPCGNSYNRATGSESFPRQVPPLCLPLPLAQQGVQLPTPPSYHRKSSCRSVGSSSSGSSSDHSSQAPVDFARQEAKTVRVKSLTSLVFPHPPDNAGEARGYVNEVLMAIGKLQKTHGSELYQWAQECLTSDEAELQADPRYPRTDREIASKLISSCKIGRFSLAFQQMVESERAACGAMPCGRAMLRKVSKHYQLERDRIGMLAERNLLSLKVTGDSVADLEAFRDKYIYVMSTIPVEDLPRPQTLFNHLIDELEHSAVMAPKVVKAREARLDSHRRTTDWLWSKVELAIQMEQQKRNRLDLDKQLRSKPAAGYFGTTTSPDENIAGAPASAPDPEPENTPEYPESQGSGGDEDFLPWRDSQTEEDMQAAPTPKAELNAEPVGSTPPSPANLGSTTPRGEEAKRAARMTAAEKAITPCMFYAYGSCRAKSCAFLHSDTNRYEGPHPRTLGKSGKTTANVSASVAAVVIPEVVANSATKTVVPAMPFKASKTVPWLWDTAAGRHLIGRQALTPAMRQHVQRSTSPVAFATGGGNQPS